MAKTIDPTSDANPALLELADLVARRTSDDAGWNTIASVIGSRHESPAMQVKLLQATYKVNKAAKNIPALIQLSKQMLQSARTNAGDSNLTDDQRAAALSAFSLSSFADDGDLLLNSLESVQPPVIQNAALATLLQFSDEQVATQLLERWAGLSPKLAERVRDGMLSRTSWAVLLLDAISVGRLPAATLSPSDLQRLASVPDDALR